MLGKIFGIISIAAFLFGIISGNVQFLGNAIIDGASNAVTLTISLIGMMCLWSGILRVLQDIGVIHKLKKITSPFLSFFFPDAFRSGVGSDEIAANVAANLLGVGNAATPLALSAMKKLQSQNENPEYASRDMITLAVLNTSSVSLVPSTVIALLRGAGSNNPFRIIIPIWICSSVCALISLVVCRLMGALDNGRVNQKKYKYGNSHDKCGNSLEETG